MSLEQTPFRGVTKNYGAREVGRAAGSHPSSGAVREHVIQLTGQSLSDLILIKNALPSGASLTGKAVLYVDEAFDLGAGTVVEIGEDGAEATNGISLTEANLESTGKVDVSGGLAGEWASTSRLPHDQDIGVALSAGSVADATVGKATLILEYDKIV